MSALSQFPPRVVNLMSTLDECVKSSRDDVDGPWQEQRAIHTKAGNAIADMFGWKYHEGGPRFSPDDLARQRKNCWQAIIPGGYTSYFDHIETFTWRPYPWRKGPVTPAAILTQPYRSVGDTVCQLVEWGFDAFAFEDSWYYPGHASAVLAVHPDHSGPLLWPFPWSDFALADRNQ